MQHLPDNSSLHQCNVTTVHFQLTPERMTLTLEYQNFRTLGHYIIRHIEYILDEVINSTWILVTIYYHKESEVADLPDKF